MAVDELWVDNTEEFSEGSPNLKRRETKQNGEGI